MCKNLLNWHRELPVSDRSIRSQFCQSQAADKLVCGASNLNSNCRLKQQMLRPESPYPSIIPDRYSTRFLCSKPLPLFSVNRHSWQKCDILAYLVWTFSTMKDVLRNRDNDYVQSSISRIMLKSLNTTAYLIWAKPVSRICRSGGQSILHKSNHKWFSKIYDGRHCGL